MVRLFAALMLMLAAVTPSLADPARHSGSPVRVMGGWSTATARAGSAPGYLRILNCGPRADYLIGASSPWARRVEIDRRVVGSGRPRLWRVRRGVRIPPHGALELTAEDYRLSLKGLRRPLQPGNRVPVNLDFRHAGRVRLHLYVGGASAGFNGFSTR